MPLQDTTSIISGYGQSIGDWATGDDRIFTGAVTGLVASDPSLTDAYFTLKLNPSDPDADAIIQKHITQSASAAGQITASGGNFVALLIHVYSGDYEALISAGTVYSWDFRAITTGGTTYTVSTGQVAFLQQVTRTDAAGTPAAAPNFGQPVWRGFISNIPSSFANLAVLFNQGDFYFNSVPTAAGPVGWVCTVGGTPGTWVAFGASVTLGLLPPFNVLYGTAAPISGTHGLGDQLWNTQPAAGQPLGWVCVLAGTPGTWKPYALVSL